MTREERVTRALAHRTIREAEALREALEYSYPKFFIEDAILAGEATLKKRVTDKRAEDNRRTVGARVPLHKYYQYKASAVRQGKTMYRWTVDAFEAALEHEFDTTY